MLFRDKMLYFATKEQTNRGHKGEIPLRHSSLVQYDPSSLSCSFMFTPTMHENNRQYELVADNPEEALKWSQTISRICKDKNREMVRQSQHTSVNGGACVRFSQVTKNLAQSHDTGLINAKQFSESVKEGFLMKAGGNVRNWRKRSARCCPPF